MLYMFGFFSLILGYDAGRGREVEFCFGVMWFGLGLDLDLDFDLAEMGREHLD